MAKNRRRAQKQKRADVCHLQTELLNSKSFNDFLDSGRQRKKWTMHDLHKIQPVTKKQEDVFELFNSGYDVCVHGSAGTGKSFIALYLLLEELLKNNTYDKIVIVRAAVTTRDQGFLPGTLEEKQALYENPYRDILTHLMGRSSTYDDMKAAGKIEFMTTSFVRGLTWDNALIMVDEGQNMNWHEINSVMTRIGENSRLIFTGDLIQTDLLKHNRDKCGMDRFLQTIKHVDFIKDVKVTTDDVVRSGKVKSWIMATEKT